VNTDRAPLPGSGSARFFNDLARFTPGAGRRKGQFNRSGARSYLCDGDASDREQPTDDQVRGHVVAKEQLKSRRPPASRRVRRVLDTLLRTQNVARGPIKCTVTVTLKAFSGVDADRHKGQVQIGRALGLVCVTTTPTIASSATARKRRAKKEERQKLRNAHLDRHELIPQSKGPTAAQTT
jgi:hypothetical protein